MIFDDIININERLAESNPFFKDIMEQGIELYNSHKYKFTKAHKLTPAEKKELAQKYFDHWFGRAQDAFKGFTTDDFQSKIYLMTRAFHSTPSYRKNVFTGILLVFTFYAPKAHDIERLLRDTDPY